MDVPKLISEQFSDETVDGWVEWAYYLGLKLDKHLPFFGVSNRERIERFVRMSLEQDQQRIEQIGELCQDKHHQQQEIDRLKKLVSDLQKCKA